MPPPRVILIGPRQRAYARQAVDAAAQGTVVTFAAPTRSNQQNARMWAMIGDVARAKPEGREWTLETWKCAFMHSLGHQVIFAQALDNSGPFPIGFRSSRLSVPQMSDLMEVIAEYGSRHQVEWREREIVG